MWTAKYVEPETIDGFPHGEFKLFDAQPNNVFFYPEGGYPQKAYRPDREHSILKVIEIAEFANNPYECGIISTYAAEFLENLEEALKKRGGTGISSRFDLNYNPTVHIVPTGKTSFGDSIFKVYVEVDYPRDRGSFVSQITTRKAFNDAVKEAGQNSSYTPKIVHIGMTNGFED